MPLPSPNLIMGMYDSCPDMSVHYFKMKKNYFFSPDITVVSLLPLKIINSLSVSPTMKLPNSEDF